MIYVLLALLIALGVGAFILFEKNILSPSVMACGVFFISTSVAALNSRAWNFVMAPITVVVIATALTAFCAGEFAAHRIYALFAKKKQPPSLTLPDKPIIVPWQITLVLCVLIAGMLAYFYTETVNYAMRYGYEKGNANLLSIVYSANVNALKTGTQIRNLLANQCMYFTRAVAYFFSYCFLFNIVFFGMRKDMMVLLLPNILFIPFIILTAGRTEFIKLFTVWIYIGSLFYLQKNHWKIKASLKIIAVFILCAAVFSVVFLSAGVLRGWSSNIQSLLRYLSLYTGGSVYALDYFLLNPPTQANTYFGEHTLLGFYNALRRLGFEFPPFYPPLEFIPRDYHAISTNVYTAIRRYIQDFHYVGMYLTVFFIGSFYSLFFLLVKNRQNILIVVYASIFYAIAEFSIEERFFMEVVSTITIRNILFLAAFHYLIINNSIKNYLKRLLKK
jgi:oligosaccharide repeat unit polymerase